MAKSLQGAHTQKHEVWIGMKIGTLLPYVKRSYRPIGHKMADVMKKEYVSEALRPSSCSLTDTSVLN